MANQIASRVHELARSNSGLKIPGFPDFAGTVKELQSLQKPPQPEFSVCIGLADALVVKESLIEYWQGKDDFKHDLMETLKKHNGEFNKKGIKRGSETSKMQEGEPAQKRLCVETDALAVAEFETKYPERCLWLNSL